MCRMVYYWINPPHLFNIQTFYGYSVLHACVQIHVIHAPCTHMWRACCVGSLPKSLSTLFSKLHVHMCTTACVAVRWQLFMSSFSLCFMDSRNQSPHHAFVAIVFYLLSHTTCPPSYLFWDMVSQWSCNSPKQQVPRTLLSGSPCATDYRCTPPHPSL